MSYRLTYRGEFSNVLATKDAANTSIPQTVRIDINDVSSGSGDQPPVNGAVTMGASSYGVLVVANGGGSSTYAELVAFFTGANGRSIRITGSNSDGDFIVTSDPVFTPPTSTPTFGFVNFNINVANVAGTLGVDGVQFEDITVAAIIPLTMTGDPLHISTIDNNEDKFTPIRSKQAEIKIFTGAGIDINTFCEGDDGRFYVEIFVDTLIMFRGFLIIPDLQQDFQPDPNVLILTATDNLGTLKDIPLVDADGDVPIGDNRLIDYLWWAIRKTGVIQPMNIINNLIPDSGSADHIYNQCFLDARTFEGKINTCINCYDVLTKILGHDCTLFQSKGEWWILRVDEIEDYLGTFQYDVAVFDPEFQSISTRALKKSIGISETMWWCEDDAIVIPDRPYKSVKLTYNFNLPLESVCNIDYSRGAFIASISPTAEEIALGYDYIGTYVLDGWTVEKGFGSSSTTPDFTAEIKRKFAQPYEKERYIFFSVPTANYFPNFIRSCPLPITEKDKFTWSFDFSSETDSGTNVNLSLQVGGILLYGNDGSVWVLGDNSGSGNYDPVFEWKLSNTDVSVNADFYPWINPLDVIGLNPSTEDMTQWRGHNITAPPAPVSGNLNFILFAANQTSGSAASFQIRYSNLRFDYIPFINGSYAKYTGQSNEVSQELVNRAAIDEEVFISDGPRLIFKGALKLYNGTDYYLATTFTDHNHATAENYGRIQAFAVWNQYRQSARNFEGNVYFIDTDVSIGGQYDGADLIHKYDLTDSNNSTNGRYFMALHFEQDLFLLSWKAFIASVQQNKVYTDDFIFQYITT